MAFLDQKDITVFRGIQSQDSFAKPIDDPDLITILCPTRGRPDQLRKVAASLDDMSNEKSLVDLCVMVDDDDEATLTLVNSDWTKQFGIQISIYVSKRPTTLAEGLNDLWKNSSNGGIYAHFTDDYTMLTPGWDSRLRYIYDNGPDDRLMVSKIRDATRNPEEFVLWAKSAEWINAVGRFVPGYFPFWFTDAWIDEVAKLVGRMVDSGISMLPMEEVDIGTHNMWNLHFWFRYYQYLLCERTVEAQYLLAIIHGIDTDSYRQALSKMEQVLEEIDGKEPFTIDQLRRMENFNTLEKNPPHERYLRAEKAARERLIELAPEIKRQAAKRALIYKNKAFQQVASE